MLTLRTLGGCYIERDGRRIDLLDGQRKALALLALLADSGDRGVSRDALMAFLWADRDTDRARTSLKQLVHSIRTQAGAPELVVGTTDLRLNPREVSSDLAAFRSAFAAREYERAARLADGPFLDGFYLREADAFERWASTTRDAIARDVARALHHLAQEASARGDARMAVEWWRRLARHEPLSAIAALGVMRALDAAGDRAAAIKHAHVYQTLVTEEVGAAPDPAVSALATQLRHAPAAAPPPPAPTSTKPELPAAPLPGEITTRSSPISRRRASRSVIIALGGVVTLVVALVLVSRLSTQRERPTGGNLPSVAVLPFSNVSGDPGDDALSDGLTDDIISTLGRVSTVRVTGRTSVFALKGHRLTMRAIAETLHVDHVLEGSVRRAGSRLRVTTQLVRARDDRVIWSESYDRQMRDFLDVQHIIATAIGEALGQRLSNTAATVIPRTQATNPAAYEAYLRGRYIWNTQLDREGIQRAARFFEQAIAQDSAFAPAWAGLSDVYARLAAFGHADARDVVPRAQAFARRALALDSTLAEAHVALAHTHFLYDWNVRDAERAYRHALALNAQYPFARVSYAILLQGQGRFDEAFAQLDSARAIDPLSAPVSNVRGRAYVSAGRPDSAIRYLTEALEMNPRLDLALEQLGLAYLHQHRPAEALRTLRQAAALSGARDSAYLAYALGVTGDADEARRIIAQLQTDSRPRPTPAYYLAIAHAGLGAPDQVFVHLQRAIDDRSLFAVALDVETPFAPYRTDPRWPALIRRANVIR